MNRLSKSLSALLLTLFFAQVFAAPGDLDTTFGAGNGWISTGFQSGSATANSVIQQSDGKLVAAGLSASDTVLEGNFQFATLVRYNADGSLDSSFNGTGKVTTAILNQNDDAADIIDSVIQQTDGKLVAAGYHEYYADGINSSIILARYNADGTLDTTVNTSITEYDFAHAVIQQTDGKLVVVGSTGFDGNDGNQNLVLLRYNPDGSLDTTFNGTGKVITTNGIGHSVIQQADGKLVAAGSSYSSGKDVFALTRYNPNGTLDTTFNSTGKVTTVIASGDIAFSVIQQADGKLLAAGSSYNGTNRDIVLVRYNSNGTLDTTFNSTGKVTTALGGVGWKNSMIQQADGRLVVAGYNATNNVVLLRYNTNGSLDNTFSGDGITTTAIGTGSDYTSSIFQQMDGKLVVAGTATNMPAGQEFFVARYESAQLDTDGDGAFDGSDNCLLVANADQLDTDGDGIGDACDAFPNDFDNDGVDDSTDNCPAISNASQTDSDGDGVGDVCDSTPHGDSDGDGVDNLTDNCPAISNASQIDSDGDGVGDVCDSTPHGDSDGDGVDNLTDNCPAISNASQIDSDGDGVGDVCDAFPNNATESKDADGDGVGNNSDNCPSVSNASQIDTDGDGVGDVCDSTPHGDSDGDGVDNLTDNCPSISNASQTDSDGNGVGDACDPAYVLAAGSLDPDFNSGSGANSSVSIAVAQADGKIIVGGNFTSYNGVTSNRVMRLNSDASLDASFNASSGPNNSVTGAVLQADGKIIIIGSFINYNNIPSSHLARLNSDGSLDSSFDESYGVYNSSIGSVVLQADGKIIIGGNFTDYSGTTRNRMARVNSDASLDTSFNPGSGANGNVYKVALQADGKIVMGGAFTTYGGTARNRVARLNSNGSLDSSFNPGSGANNIIYTTVLQTNGQILIGGDFTSYNGTTRTRMARLNSDGSLDTSFNPGSGTNGTVYMILVQADGKIVIGGAFTTYNGTARKYIARLNSDGSLDTSFNQGTGANDNVYTGFAEADGSIVIGGNFTSYNGIAKNHLARIHSGDSDHDGIEDAADKFAFNAAASSDTDSDGFPNVWNAACDTACQLASGLTLDNCPSVASASQIDTDGDGIGDACDPTPNFADKDLDGIGDSSDNCPLLANADQLDSDGDGVGNACDSTPHGDSDSDGIDNLSDNCPFVANASQADADHDGIGDACDAMPNDTDNDGVDNLLDNCPLISNASQTDTDADGIGDVCDSTPNGDNDGDGVDNLLDNCPLISNASQLDTDHDGTGNACDDDDDNDGVPDLSDPFPLNAAEWADTDGDTVGDNSDNCPTVSNVDQLNTDGDAQGNACDSDDDNDGMPDAWEILYGLNPLDPVDVGGNPDGDGLINLEEFNNGTNPFVYDAASYDFNHDGNSDLLMRNVVTGQNQIWIIKRGVYTLLNTLTTNSLTADVVAVLDTDGDEDSDILWYDTTGTQLIIWVMQDGVKQANAFLGNTGAATLIGTGDFDGDGDTDILLKTGLGAVKVWTIQNNAKVLSTNIGTPSGTFKVIDTGDFNGDGIDDVVMQNASGLVRIWQLNSSAQVASVTDVGTISTVYKLKKSGDTDHDGDDDLVFRNDTTGQTIIWEMQDGARAAIHTLSSPNPSMQLVTVTDFDKDGDEDLMFRDTTPGDATDGDTTLWIMQNNDKQSTSNLGNRSVNYKLEYTADFDGDGDNDILYYNYVTGDVLVWAMQNGVRDGDFNLGSATTDWQPRF